MRHCYDAMPPSANPPDWWICAFYIYRPPGRAWTDAEINSDPARFGLPIGVYTGSDIATEGDFWAANMLSWLESRRIPKGSTVCMDTETGVYQAFLKAADAKLHGQGYPMMNYASLGNIRANFLPSGGRWVADWDDIINVGEVPGQVAQQYASGTMLHTDYDASIIEDKVVLWEKKPPVTPPVTSWEDLTEQYVSHALGDLGKAQALLKLHIPN